MRKLQRGAAPVCLSKFRHGVNNWADVSPADKAEIWQELEAMQGERCAYCEGEINKANRHIEHLRQKGRDPSLTFAWSNLFGSCNREDSCGKHKDRCPIYLPPVLIKPDSEDPEHYLVFDQHGGVSPRNSLTAAEHHRATETIRIFNLDVSLRAIRFSHVTGYVQTAEYFAELEAQYEEAEWLPLLEQEIADTAHLPFATAIKHVLTRQG